MAKKKYEGKLGSRLSKRDAQVVGERLEKLTGRGGGELTTNSIVDDARSKSSPLHKHFDWDNTTAAEKYRKVQARHLMGSVVEVVMVKGRPKQCRSFFNVTNVEGQKVYVTLKTATVEPDYIYQLITEAQEQIQQLSETLNLIRLQSKKVKKKR